MDYLQFRRVYHDDLLHFGIKRRSGRYPYGSGERPFQSEGGRKKRIKGKERDVRRKEELVTQDRITYIKKEFQSEKEKKKFLDTATNATEVLQYRDQLTQKELEAALGRIKTIRELSGISKKEKDAAWDAVNNAMKKVGNVKDWAKTGLESFGVFQQLMAALSGDKAKQDWSKENQKSLEQILNLLKDDKPKKGGKK